MTKKRPTQSDVARLAGVSRGTVSMVLNKQINGRVPISESTRQRVLQAAHELGYAPNPVAKMLVQGSNRLIGVFTYEPVFPFDKHDFFFPYLSGIEGEASRQDYDVLLFTRNRTHQPPHIYHDNMNSLRLADGSILLGARPDRGELARLVTEGYPFVFIGRRDVPGCELYWVANDYRMGSYEAVRHLIELGHKTLGFVPHGLQLEPQQDKLTGCRQALAEAPDVKFVVLPDMAEHQPGDLLAMIKQYQLSALVCDSHTSFAKSIYQLQEAGLRVPDDLSVLCLTTIDEGLPFSLQPTYVKLNRDQLGVLAVKMLSQRISGDLTEPQQIYIPCHLVAGETTAAPSS